MRYYKYVTLTGYTIVDYSLIVNDCAAVLERGVTKYGMVPECQRNEKK